MAPQYAQMRMTKYEAPQWLVEPGDIADAEDVYTLNAMVAQGELEEVWSEEAKGWEPYTDIVRIYSARLDQTYHSGARIGKGIDVHGQG